MAKNMAQSSLERNTMISLEQKLPTAKRCSHGNTLLARKPVFEIFSKVSLLEQRQLWFGAKAAVVATIANAIPTLASARMFPWARANLNHTAQALIISTVAGAAYFIVADKTILASATFVV